MGRLTARLVQSAYKVSLARNGYNDVVYTTSNTAVPCLFRDISITTYKPKGEEVTYDGQLWFDADYTPAKGEVYLLDGIYLRIDDIVVAQSRLRSNAVEFYKCMVSKQRQVS